MQKQILLHLILYLKEKFNGLEYLTVLRFVAIYYLFGNMQKVKKEEQSLIVSKKAT